MNTQNAIVKVDQNSTALTVLAAAAIQAGAREGITFQVTRQGAAPIVPFKEYDPVRKVDFLIQTADEERIKKLKKHKVIRERFDIIDRCNVPYEIIVADEIKKPKRKTGEVVREVVDTASDTFGAAGTVLGALGGILFGVASVTADIAIDVLGKDPIVYARIPTGEWIEVARYDD